MLCCVPFFFDRSDHIHQITEYRLYKMHFIRQNKSIHFFNITRGHPNLIFHKTHNRSAKDHGRDHVANIKNANKTKNEQKKSFYGFAPFCSPTSHKLNKNYNEKAI